MSLFGKLFGGGSGGKDKTVEPVIYEDFSIFLEPVKEPGGYRVAARIEKEVGGELKTHMMMRADVVQSEDEARSMTLQKAQTFIDQMGERIFR